MGLGVGRGYAFTTACETSGLIKICIGAHTCSFSHTRQQQMIEASTDKWAVPVVALTCGIVMRYLLWFDTSTLRGAKEEAQYVQ